MIRLVPEDGEVHLGSSMIIVTPTEMTLLVRIAEGNGHFVRRIELARTIDSEFASDHLDNVKTYISRLRRRGIPIESRRGYGYRLAPSGSQG
jgi:DNA-binding response OmpR family regulator